MKKIESVTAVATKSRRIDASEGAHRPLKHPEDPRTSAHPCRDALRKPRRKLRLPAVRHG